MTKAWERKTHLAGHGQREAGETERARRCQPQISQATQKLLAFNAHCLPLFTGERGTSWSVLEGRWGQMADDSLGAEFKNIKLEACVLKWGSMAWECTPTPKQMLQLPWLVLWLEGSTLNTDGGPGAHSFPNRPFQNISAGKLSLSAHCFDGR